MYRLYNLQSASDQSISLYQRFLLMMKDFWRIIIWRFILAKAGWAKNKSLQQRLCLSYWVWLLLWNTMFIWSADPLWLLHFLHSLLHIYSFKCFAQSLFMRSGCNCFTKYFFSKSPAVHKLKEVCNNLLIYALSIFEYYECYL